MNPSLDWLKGKRIAKVEKIDFSWFFTFTEGGLISTESFWRLITPERLVVASKDHGELFGLKEPVDAARRVMSTIEAKTIIEYSCLDVCSDLILFFEGKIQLQLLNDSCGYESWRAMNDGIEIICMGGGGLTVFNQK